MELDFYSVYVRIEDVSSSSCYHQNPSRPVPSDGY